MRKLLAFGLILTVLILSGCETAKGLGRDFQSAGQWIQERT